MKPIDGFYFKNVIILLVSGWDGWYIGASIEQYLHNFSLSVSVR